MSFAFFFQTALANKDAEIEQLKTDHSSVQAEQEDLLMMLSDQDSKLKLYKKKLRILGEAHLSPDEEEEDEELSDWWTSFRKHFCFYMNQFLWYIIYHFSIPFFLLWTSINWSALTWKTKRFLREHTLFFKIKKSGKCEFYKN